MYRITISPRAKKHLQEIEKLYRRAVSEAINDIRVDPFIGKPLSREMLGKYSYRIGTYRIIYTINLQDKRLLIHSAGHRATVYKRTR